MKKSLRSELLEQRCLMDSTACTTSPINVVFTCSTGSKFTVPAQSPTSETFAYLAGGSVVYDSVTGYQSVQNPSIELRTDEPRTAFSYKTQLAFLSIRSGDSTTATEPESYRLLTECRLSGASGHSGGESGLVCKDSATGNFLGNFWTGGSVHGFPLQSVIATNGLTDIIYTGSSPITIPANSYVKLMASMVVEFALTSDDQSCSLTNSITLTPTQFMVTHHSSNTPLLVGHNPPQFGDNMVVDGSITSGPVGIWNPSFRWASCSDLSRAAIIAAVKAQFRIL